MFSAADKHTLQYVANTKRSLHLPRLVHCDTLLKLLIKEHIEHFNGVISLIVKEYPELIDDLTNIIKTEHPDKLNQYQKLLLLI